MALSARPAQSGSDPGIVRRNQRFVAVAGAALSLVVAAGSVHAADNVAPAGAGVVHVVQPGETLSQIAADSGVDVATVVTLNQLADANALSVGQSLTLGGNVPRTAGGNVPTVHARNVPAARQYTIADGDTLSSIAQQFSTTAAQLTEANELTDPDHLAVGSQLAVPSSRERSTQHADEAETAAAATRPQSPPKPSPSPAKPAPNGAAKRSLVVTYTVQPGETLNAIARQFDVKADAIARANNVDDANKIAVGSVLKVPLPGQEHVVTAGETLRDIAQREKVDLGALIDFNEVDDPEVIHVGQVVMVPRPTAQTRAAAPPAAAPSAQPTSNPAPQPAAAPPAQPASNPAPQPATSPPAQPVSNPAQPASNPAPQPAAPTPAPPAAVVAPPSNAPTDGLVGVALKFLGARYVWGGSSPSGFDCSGFVWYVAKQIGKPLSRGMFGQYNSGSHPARNELKPGDLVFFQNTYTPGLSHNGIYIGNNQFVNAVDPASGVTISDLTTAYWSSHWYGATRLA